MIKLMIFDDDGIILKGLSTKIGWETHGIHLTAIARNGEDGLAAIERNKPQIVITDIRMPFLDGLELAEIVKDKYPDIKIIVMTSYDEFEFAQKALKLKVFDFVLKPVENELLLKTVQRAAKEWEREQTLLKKVVEGMPLLRQRFLEQLVKGRLQDEEIRTEAAFLDLSLSAAYYTVAVLKADEYHHPDNNRFGREMLKYCIHNLSEETIGEHGVVFDSFDDEMVLLYMGNGRVDEADQEVHRIAENIRANIKFFLKTSVTIGVGTNCERLADVSFSYQEAKCALDIRHLTGTDQVIRACDVWIRPNPDNIRMLYGKDQELALKVKLGLKQEALEIVDVLEKVVENHPVSLERLRFFGMEIIFSLARELLELDAQTDHMIQLIFGKLQHIVTAKEIFAEIRSFSGELSDIANEKRSSQQKQLVGQAVCYIETHYGREGLSLQEVAAHIPISPAYLSTIFKKEKHINFSDFVLETRMKAAMTLMRGEELKTYEVAERVGYSNPQYFSVSFKKYTGCSPSEFKQMM